MKKINGYIRSAWYNILHNQTYALFCVFGTALTFIFITIVLQLGIQITSDNPPFINSERTFVIDTYEDSNGRYVDGIAVPAMSSFMETVKGCEQYYITNGEWINMLINGRLHFDIVQFANDKIWTVNQFDFIEGRPYTKQEEDDRVPLAVVTESFAKSNYKGASAIGQELSFQGNTYKVIGVIADYADVVNSREGAPNVWASCVFNKFIPSYGSNFVITILFEKGISSADMKASLSNAVQFYFKNRNIDVDFTPNKISSVRESTIKQFGGDIFAYGVGVILFFLLLIPAINILTLSNANVNNRASEIAIRRAMGASQGTSFWQIMTESFILVLIGTLLGVLLTYPATELISNTIMGGGFSGDFSIITNINMAVIFCGVLPLCMLFTLLTGGLPAYFIAKRNISELLKGGSKW